MPPPPRHARFAARRGTVLIVAMLVAALIALVLGSYLNFNLSSTRFARRTFNGYAALNLAEAGTEEGVWSFNRVAAGDNTAWSGWSNNGTSAWQTFSNFDLTSNITGSVKVYVDYFNPPSGVQPKVIAQCSVGAPGELPVVKLVEVTLRRRSYFTSGLVAKNQVVFNGANASVDSWNSDPVANPVDYSAAVRNDHGSVGSGSVLSTGMAVNQANIWGFIATGGAQPQVGVHGSIRGASTPANVRIDPNRVSTDFNASFDEQTAPSDGTVITALGPTLGTAGQATRWQCDSIDLSGNQTLTILGNVTIILTGTQSLSVTGNASIIVPPGSTLTIYAAGDVKIAGRGLANANIKPISFLIWGTTRSQIGQSIDIVGNGALRAVVYAPNGDVSINGNGDVMGSVVARNITVVGNAAYHYDESLAQWGDSGYGVATWRELTTAADRASYTGVFDSW